MPRLSEIDEVLLLIFGWHGMALLRLSVAVEILSVNQVSDFRHPRRANSSVNDHSPVDTAEPFVLLDLFGSILIQKHIKYEK